MHCGDACQLSLKTQQKLPSYVCEETIHRFDKANTLKDIVNAQVTVSNGREIHRQIGINGKQTGMKLSQLSGMWSSGEFGTLLPQLFAPENKARFEFKGDVELESRRALLYSFEIRDGDNSSFFVWDEDPVYKPGYRGSIWLDKHTLQAIRVDMASTRRGTQFVEMDVDYGEVELADGSLLVLPLRANMSACAGEKESCIRNQVEYKSCHKFGAAKVLDAQ